MLECVNAVYFIWKKRLLHRKSGVLWYLWVHMCCLKGTLTILQDLSFHFLDLLYVMYSDFTACNIFNLF
jgi:hypothetical protein